MREKEKTVLAMPAGETYDIVIKNSIHAYPSSYPKARDYFVPIRKKGVMEYLYRVVDTIECYIDDIDEYRSVLTEEQFTNLYNYHRDRLKGFNYGSPHEKYRFCILEKCGDIVQPYIKKGVRRCVGLNLEDIPLYQNANAVQKIAKRAVAPTVNMFVEYQGESICVDEIVDKVHQISGKRRLKSLSVYYQPENDIAYYVADEDEGSFFVSDSQILPLQDKKIVNPKVDNEYDEFIIKLHLPADVKAVKYKNHKTIALSYQGKSFAELAYTHSNYHLRTRRSILNILAIEYDIKQYKGKNSACVSNIGFENTLLLENVIELVKSGFDYDEKPVPATDEEQETYFRQISMDELTAIARARGSRKPRISTTQVNVFARDAAVREYALRRANGICQLCGNEAPFKKEDGTPYLESHHIIWLKDGGEDSIENTVALCPNCHRKMHYLNDPDDREYLEEKNKTVFV